MSVIYEGTYLVDTRDVDPFGQCRPSAILGFLQETASMAALALHVDRDALIEKYHLFWMVARIWYRLGRPLRWNERITIQTWHRGGKGASSYRDFDLLVDGKPVGEAVSLWVLADMETHKLARMSGITEFIATDGGDRCKERMLPKLRLPEELRLEESRRLHYGDADVNGHVNNARYADFLCDTLHLETMGAGRFVSQLQLGYLAECRPGEQLNLYTAQEGEKSYVCGTDHQKIPRFDGFLTLGELT